MEQATQKYNEIFKLKEMLEKEKIPFSFFDNSDNFGGYKMYRIAYPYGKDCKCSVVEGAFSYGGDVDLLEIMGLLTMEEGITDGVCGWLTADEVFKRIKTDYKKQHNGKSSE